MRNEILIPSAVVPNAYYLGPMGNPDLSDFINQETNRIPFKQSVIDLSSWNTKLLLETGPKCLKDGEIGFARYQKRKLEIGKFLI